MKFLYLIAACLLSNIVLAQNASKIKSIEIGVEMEDGKYELSKGDLVDYSAFILSDIPIDFEAIQITLIDENEVIFKNKFSSDLFSNEFNSVLYKVENFIRLKLGQFKYNGVFDLNLDVYLKNGEKISESKKIILKK